MLEEANLFNRSRPVHFGKSLLMQTQVNLQEMMLQPPRDLLPITPWIALPETTWVTLCQTFTQTGILFADVPRTSDAESHPLLNFLFSPRSALLFLLLNLHFHSIKGRDFVDGMAHFVILGLRLRFRHFLEVFRHGGKFWNRQYEHFLVKLV